jgi:hypothetical protein
MLSLFAHVAPQGITFIDPITADCLSRGLNRVLAARNPHIQILSVVPRG